MKAGNSTIDTPSTTPLNEQQEISRHARSFLRGRALVGLGAAWLVIFALLTGFVLFLDPLALDVPITRELQEIDFQPFGDLMRWASWPGFSPQNFIWPVLVIVVVGVLLKRMAGAAFLALAAVANFATDVVKLLVHRGRPSPDLVHVIGTSNTYSFPSGHVVQYVLFFGFCFYLVFTLMKRSLLRTLLLALCGALVVLVGPSRVWLGNHWFSDVLGGYTLGTGLLLLIIWGYRGWEARRAGLAVPIRN